MKVIQQKHCLKLFMTLSTLMMKRAMMIDNQMKKAPSNMLIFKIIMKEI